MRKSCTWFLSRGWLRRNSAHVLAVRRSRPRPLFFIQTGVVWREASLTSKVNNLATPRGRPHRNGAVWVGEPKESSSLTCVLYCLARRPRLILPGQAPACYTASPGARVLLCLARHPRSVLPRSLEGSLRTCPIPLKAVLKTCPGPLKALLGPAQVP